MYKILFLHKTFPGQFRHLARHLAAQKGIEVLALATDFEEELPGVTQQAYSIIAPGGGDPHPYLHEPDRSVWRGQAVLAHCVGLARQGYAPDLVIGHNGWGEILFIKDIWPQAGLVGYFEFFYRATGADVGFEPGRPASLDDFARVRVMNAVNLLGLEAVDHGVCPTGWQRELYPGLYRDRLSLIHDGIDTDLASPGVARALALPDGRLLDGTAPIVTYVARNLEPYRGIGTALRAAATFLHRRPDAHFALAGGDGVSYGMPPQDGRSWRDHLLAELDGRLPLERVHFLGHLPHADFINLMRLSHAHLYLTYPFVLSWSMLEAMSTGVTLVASQTGPVQEVVQHGRNGLLVPFHDPEAVAAGVLAALELPEGQRDAMRAAARQTVLDRYDLRRVALPAWLDMLRARFGLPA